jgi:hypothetical protein
MTGRPVDVKAAVIAAIDESWRDLRRTLSTLNSAGMEKPGVNGDWSIKDLLGHISTWEMELLAVLSSGIQARYPDLDGFNAREVKSKESLSARDILIRLEDTHRALRDALIAAPAAYFEHGSPIRKSIDEDTVNHYEEHLMQIKTWARKAGGGAGVP